MNEQEASRAQLQVPSTPTVKVRTLTRTAMGSAREVNQTSEADATNNSARPTNNVSHNPIRQISVDIPRPPARVK